jgi:hypothetical protein
VGSVIRVRGSKIKSGCINPDAQMCIEKEEEEKVQEKEIKFLS